MTNAILILIIIILVLVTVFILGRGFNGSGDTTDRTRDDELRERIDSNRKTLDDSDRILRADIDTARESTRNIREIIANAKKRNSNEQNL